MSNQGVGTSTPASGPVRKEKRKLACHACRARRIRCEWPESGGNGCIACGLADLRCPGEPEPRKRQKRNDGGSAPVSTPSSSMGMTALVPSADNSLTKLDLGGALTFHLIESLFIMANPSVAGLSYNLYREILNSAGGSSHEVEIAAECLCSAFIASAATFSDHSSIVGPGNIEMPTDLPGGTNQNYQDLIAYGPRRRAAVEELVRRAVTLCDECKLRDSPIIESVYTLLAYDQMMTLTSEEGRKSREYVDAAITMYQLLPKESGTGWERLGLHLLGVDAETAAVLKRPCSFTDFDITTFFPSINFEALPPITFNAEEMVPHEEGWTNLGNQLTPLSLALTALYRRFAATSSAPPSSFEISRTWRAVDQALQTLDECDHHVSGLPALDTQELTDLRRFDLTGLTNSRRRAAVRLDLLVHDHLIYAVLGSGQPSAELLGLLQDSGLRVQRDFELVSRIARHATSTRSLLYVRRLFEMLEVSTSWKSLRTSEPKDCAALLSDLGITPASAESLMTALDLASWSSVVAAQQKKCIRTGLEAMGAPQVAQALPPPPVAFSPSNGGYAPAMHQQPMPPLPPQFNQPPMHSPPHQPQQQQMSMFATASGQQVPMFAAAPNQMPQDIYAPSAYMSPPHSQVHPPQPGQVAFGGQPNWGGNPAYQQPQQQQWGYQGPPQSFAPSNFSNPSNPGMLDEQTLSMLAAMSNGPSYNGQPAFNFGQPQFNGAQPLGGGHPVQNPGAEWWSHTS